MKEATGEVSGTVITIVIIALIGGVAALLFTGDDPIAKRWIENMFEEKTGITAD